MTPLVIDAALLRHLELAGVALTPDMTGVRPVHVDTLFEPPVTLLGVDIWRDRVAIGAFSYVCAGSVIANATIGRYCSISEGVRIGMTRHPADWLTTSPAGYVRDFMNFERHLAASFEGWERGLAVQDYDIRPQTVIGNDVWIGTQVYIKDGVTIGDGAIIGAHSVVTHDVAPFSIVAGNPARPIRQRFDDAMVERLAALRWWDYAILDFAGWDVRDVAGAAGALEDAIAARAVLPYAPAKVDLVGEAARLRVIQQMMDAAA